jgi:hypothetical protein
LTDGIWREVSVCINPSNFSETEEPFRVNRGVFLVTVLDVEQRAPEYKIYAPQQQDCSYVNKCSLFLTRKFYSLTLGAGSGSLTN